MPGLFYFILTQSFIFNVTSMELTNKQTTNVTTLLLEPLNGIGNQFDLVNNLVDFDHMEEYFCKIKGGYINLLDIDRRFHFTKSFSVECEYYLERDNWEWFCNEDNTGFFNHHQHGYVMHRPFSNWAYETKHGFFVRNELDCVGYCGIDLLNCWIDDELGEKQGELLFAATAAVNILPSLFAERLGHPWTFACNNNYQFIYRNNTSDNFIQMVDWDFNDVFVQVTDYDITMLMYVVPELQGIEILLGKQGYTCRSSLMCPPLKMLDGYTFWYWLYNRISVRAQFLPSYHLGTPKRNERRRKQTQQDRAEEIYPISHLFIEPKVDIEIQVLDGLIGSLFGTSDRPSILKSIQEIGQFSQTANGFKDTYDRISSTEWFTEVINFIQSVASSIGNIVSDFKSFSADPIAYCKYLVNSFRFSITLPKVSFIDTTKILLIGGAALYLYEKSQILSVGLMMFAIHSSLKQMIVGNDRLLRSCTMIGLLTYIGIMKATQLRPASIEIQSSSSNLSSMIFAATSFITLAVAGKGCMKSQDSIVTYLSKNTRDVFNMSKGGLALFRCVEYVIDVLNKAVEFVFGETCIYKAIIKASITSQDLQEYIEYALSTDAEQLASKLTLDRQERDKWERMCGLHLNFIKLFSSKTPPQESRIGFSMYSKAYNCFNLLRDEFDKIKDSLDYFRVEPFMVWIWGRPGTGKTWCRDQFVNNMYRWHTTIDPSVSDVRKTGLLYVRNPSDKYMSKYKGQFAVGYDDVGQNRQADNPEFNEIMAVGSTNQVRLNMADLVDKGQMFSSKVIIMAANSRNVNSNNLIMKEEAFNRRRHVVIQVDRPDIESTVLATSKCDFSKVSLVVSDSLNGTEIVKFPKSGFGDNDKIWREFFEWLAPHYVNHIRSQKEALVEKEIELEAVLNGKAHKSVVDIRNDGTPIIVEPRLNPTDYGTISTETTGHVIFTEASPPLTTGEVKEYLKDFKTNLECILYLQKTNPEVSDILDEIRNLTVEEYEDSLLRSELKRAVEKYLPYPLLPKDELYFVKNDTLDQDEIDEKEISGFFSSVIEKQKNAFPWVKLIGLATGIGTCIGAYKLVKHLFTSESKDIFDVQGYSLETQAPPTTNVIINGYDLNPQAPPTQGVVIQNDIMHMASLYMRNVARIYRQTSDTNCRAMNMVNLCYNTWLVPRHFFDKDINDCSVIIRRDNKPDVEVTVLKSQIIQCDNVDLCVVNIPSIEHGRSIMKHIATRDQLKSTRNFNSLVLNWDEKLSRSTIVCTGVAERWDVPLSVNHDGVALYYPSGYSYNWSSSQGDCGSLLMSSDHTSVAKLMGIHFGYNKTTQKALSVMVSREYLEMYVDKITPVLDRIEATDPQVTIQDVEMPSSLIAENGVPYFEYLGLVDDAPLPPQEHKDLYRSPLWNFIYPATKDLSVLKKNDPRMDVEFRGDPDILTRGVIDFSYHTKNWPDKELSIASEALLGEFKNFRETISRDVKSLDWAINGEWIDGARIEHTEPLNLKTSAGYGLKGKKFEHFSTSEIRNSLGVISKVEHSINNEKLKEMVDTIWDGWMKGETTPTIWSHALKSEAIKMSKIKNGNTRTFCVAQTAFLLNVRRLFGSFTVAMKNTKVKSFSCLGTDVFSTDWTDLYNDLRKTGPNGADMDFFKFDRTAVTWQLARKVVESINKWYDDDMIYQRARLIAFEDLIFSYALVGKYLTRKNRGNPSGNPLTTELNNCINYLMLNMVYLLIAKQKKPDQYSIRSWKKNVNVKTYGDDIIFTLHPECEQWFDFELLTKIYSDYGVPVTPADKSDKGITIKPLEELQFLKCNFLPYDHPFYKWQAGLSKASIQSMVQFYRLKPNNGTVEEAVRVNAYESLVFAHHWGKEFFDLHYENLNKAFTIMQWPPITSTFEEHDEIYRQKLEG